MEQRLSLVTLGVGDLAKSRRFYTEGLGWKPSSASTDEVVFIQVGGMALALYSKRALADDMGIDHFGLGFCGITLAYNARTREEVDVVLSHAEAAGARIMKPAQDVFWGGYAGYFADPDGYSWEVAWNPHFKLDEQGNLHLPD